MSEGTPGARTAIDRDTVPQLAKKARVVHDRHSGKDMILYPERGLELNAAAAAIARKCDGSRSIAEMAVELAREHDGASVETIERDVIELVISLRDRGLLVPPGSR